MRQPAEAAEHLDWLRAADPDDPAVLLQLALCWDAQGVPDEAAGLLDRVIAANPTGATALFHRGRLELNRRRPEAAVPYLRRAADAAPGDLEVLNSLAVALQQIGAADEARAVEERRQRAEADLRRVAELVERFPRRRTIRICAEKSGSCSCETAGTRTACGGWRPPSASSRTTRRRTNS